MWTLNKKIRSFLSPLYSFFLASLLLLSGCSYIDWDGVWFGCSKDYVKQPARYGMFGTVKEPSVCIPVEEKAYPAYSAESQEQRRKDFQECTEMQLQSNETVKACMARKGWKP